MKELFEKQDKEFENWVDAQVFPPPKLKELPVIYWRRITKALVKKYISKVRQETLDWVKEEIKILSDSKEHQTDDHYLGYEEAVDNILQTLNNKEDE